MIQETTSLRKIAALKKRIKVVRGGQGAGKTVSILILLINHASSNPDREILIISAELTKMRLTVIKDFIKIMKLAGLYDENRFLAETLYKFPNGSFIKFIGLDKTDVGKGLRCHVAYFNEVNKCDFESYRQVATRAAVVYADYNPDAEFFIDTDVIPREDCDFLNLTYVDNELLSTVERDEILLYKQKGYNTDGSIKSAYYANLWNVYGLGNIGNLQGVVFDNWTHADELPNDARFLGYGMDFGFTNDPTTLTGVWLLGEDLYLKELIYQTDLTGSDITNKMHALGIDKRDEIFADCADPRTIEEIRRRGFNIKESIKGPDSVNAGIDTLKRYTLKVLPGSENLAKELRAYKWLTDRNGKAVNKPEDFMNHSIDGVRYVAASKLRKPERTGKRYTMV